MSTAVYVGIDTYKYNYEEDGMWERDIECSDCGTSIGAHQHDTEDSTVETFTPYWMHDMDNNFNLCDVCHNTKFVPTLTDWASLACRLAMGLRRAHSNWQEVAGVTPNELEMLNDWMGEDWA